MDILISAIVGVAAVGFVVVALWVYNKNKHKFGGCHGDCSKCKGCQSRQENKK